MLPDFFSGYKDICVPAGDSLVLIYPHCRLPAMPLIRNQNIDLNNLRYTGFQNTRTHDSPEAEEKTVGFFLEDPRIEPVCRSPWRYTARLAQYRQVFSPDLGCNADTPLEEQWMNVCLSRLAGAYWQHCGLAVVPSVSWSGSRSFDFCAAGVEKGAVIAVSTNGTRAVRDQFMAGFFEVCRQIEPSAVICYCTPYQEMNDYALIFPLEHEGNRIRKFLRHRPYPGQLEFPFYGEKIFTGGA